MAHLVSKYFTCLANGEHFSVSREEGKEGKGESESFTAPYLFVK